MSTIAMKELIGTHELSGVDHLLPEGSQYQNDVDVMRFTLDGIHYLATEDPDDGYRSMLGTFDVVSDGPTTTFDPIPVVISVSDESYDATHRNADYYKDTFTGILTMCDARNGQVILQVGTKDWDDYYPYCVMEWTPENISTD